ncbi:MAG: hypothetical protein Q9160_000060 [Pyrenula sp. 1 TL-2023]
MSNGVTTGGARTIDPQQLSEREIKAAKARVPIPMLFPRKGQNDKSENAAAVGDRNAFDNTDVEDADNTLSTRYSPVLSTEALDQVNSHGAVAKESGLRHGSENYNSDNADDLSQYSYSGGRSQAWNILPEGAGFADPEHDAMMDQAIQQGQEQIRKHRHTHHQSYQASSTRPQSPLSKPKSRGHGPKLRQTNDHRDLDRKQIAEHSRGDNQARGRVTIPKPSNDAILNKNFLHSGIFSTQEIEQPGGVNFGQVNGREQVPFGFGAQFHPFTEATNQKAFVANQKPDLQILTKLVPQTINTPTGLDKVSSYTDTSPDPTYSASITRGLENLAEQKGNNKRPLQLDYDSPVLANKSLKELQNEPYDVDPRSKPFQFTSFDAHEATTLPEKLERLSSHSHDDHVPFFTTVNMAEWEECGDWLIDRFAALMGQLKEGRKARRQLAYRFEAEIRRQHDKTEKERTDIESMIQSMRTGGIGVMQQSGSTKAFG